MAADRPLVTVGIPFYNSEATIADAIRSVFGQTERNWELLLVDDGSTDGSLDVARSVRDDRVRVVSDGVNRQLPRRLNEIASIAAGTYLARMDADDVMHPERLERQVSFLDRHPDTDVLGSAAFIMNGVGKVRGIRSYRLEEGRTSSLRQVLFVHPTVMARTDWFRNHPYDISYPRAEDFELWCRVAPFARLACLPEPLLFYREPRVVDLARYRASLAYVRRILRRYGPGRIGRMSTTTLLCKTYLKELLHWAASICHCEALLVERRSARLDQAVYESAQRMLDGILASALPGLRGTDS